MPDNSQSIQDHFFREEKQQLEYDDSAFYIFFISLLSIFLVPSTYHVLTRMIWGETDLGLGGKNCQCSKCVAKQTERTGKAKKTWIRGGFIAKLVTLALMWYLFFLTAKEVSEIKPIKTFDPYVILELEVGAELSEIKNKYRRLSVKYHPDKNMDDPLAK
jgi:translocation protein SEC63